MARLYQKTRTKGQRLKINGTIALKIDLSDIYSWVSSFDASGRFERVPPLLAYDELTSLPQATLWSILPITYPPDFIDYRSSRER